MEIQAKFFPVGHGLTYAFKVDKCHVLFDINKRCDFDNLEAFFGNKTIDVMIISHFHTDHTNGIKELYRRGFNIKKIYIPYADDDITLFYELYFWRRGYDFNEFRRSLDGTEVIPVEGTLYYEYSLIRKIWNFNIHQHRGNEDTMIRDIKDGLKKLGLLTNDDIRKNLSKMESDIKNVYMAATRKKLNITSIFLAHGPAENVVQSSEFIGLEYMSRNPKKDNQTKFYSLITGDCNLEENKSIIEGYAPDLGYVLVPHHSGINEWASYLCECKDNSGISWIVTISEVRSRPYGLVVSDIYRNHQELYICDAKSEFVYSFY